VKYHQTSSRRSGIANIAKRGGNFGSREKKERDLVPMGSEIAGEAEGRGAPGRKSPQGPKSQASERIFIAFAKTADSG